jgi:hypothetical protein
MYSITDRASPAYQLIQTVAHQEMLHLQCICNIANAFGVEPKFELPKYEGQKIPHIDFSLNEPDPRTQYSPFSAELGPLDEKRINAMCLIEYPNWLSGPDLNFLKDCKGYGNIGEFYIALRDGIEVFQDQIKGKYRQVDYFSSFYRKMPNMIITEDGKSGFFQAALLIDLITDQGEGIGPEVTMDKVYQNTADDKVQEQTHFTKFTSIRDQKLPEVYKSKKPQEYSPRQKDLLEILKTDFESLLLSLSELFNGKHPPDFIKNMISIGSSMHNCWKNEVTPKL